MAREHLRLHGSLYEITENLTNEEFGKLIRGALFYLLTDKDPELTGNERFVFPFLKYQVDIED